MRSLVMLAKDYEPLKFKAEGSFMSEKYDGVRALWLPWSRGLPIGSVPFANRARDIRDYTCSGLWSRRGKVIVAPDQWLDRLPKEIPLDGELFSGRGLFQRTTSTIRKLEPDLTEWGNITYQIFDMPSYKMFFETGQIREGGTAGEPAYEVFFNFGWPEKCGLKREGKTWHPREFSATLKLFPKENDVLRIVPQVQLPFTSSGAATAISEKLAEVLANDGEGVMLRRPHSTWIPHRSVDLVKVKPVHSDEGVVVGHQAGLGKFSGMMGALLIQWNDKRFAISGFNDSERQVRASWQDEFIKNEGKVYDGMDCSEQFPIASHVRFQYNDVTDDGIPRFARFFR